MFPPFPEEVDSNAWGPTLTPSSKEHMYDNLATAQSPPAEKQEALHGKAAVPLIPGYRWQPRCVPSSDWMCTLQSSS